MNSNVMGWQYGKNEGRTYFEELLDKTDKALELRNYANAMTPYSPEMYDTAQTLTRIMFYAITGDLNIANFLDNMWADCQEDIRYMLNYYFCEMTYAADDYV